MWKKLLCLALGLALGISFLDDFDPDVLKGKKVVITGASTGIGEQIAYQFAKFGADVFITSRRDNVLQQVTDKCRSIGHPDGKYLHLAADMSNMSSTEEVIKEASARLGGIDILVLNHILKINMATWEGSAANLTLLDKIFDVNFKSYIHLSSHALPHLQTSRGSIVVISSIAGKMGLPALSMYSATKFALNGFFGSLRQEFHTKGCGISITLCTIGMIGTENAMSQMSDYGVQDVWKWFPPAQPEEAALAIVKGGVQRFREVFFPYFQTKPVALLRDWIPGILDAFNAFIYSN
ncbi:hypothetical protein ScPMuIL_002409 [Solemya velum]